MQSLLGIYVTALTVFALHLTGCSKGPKVDTVSASGTVTYKGAPLDGARVAFVNKENGFATTGMTDINGRFELQTFMGGAKMVKGAMPGDYKVTITKIDASGATMPAFNATGDVGTPVADLNAATEDPGKLSQAKDVIPQKYMDPEQSGFTAAVKPSGENHFTFDVTD